MKRTLSLCLTMVMMQFNLCLIFLPNNVLAQSASNQITLADGTPVKLRLNRTMSSADAKTGETVDFDVMEEVKVGEQVFIPRSSIAMASVSFAKPRGRMGKGGKLDIVLDSIRLLSGDKIPLRASKETKGGGSTGVMTGAIVASSIIFFPVAPIFLLMKGKDITIPKGTEITAYVAGDITLDAKKLNGGQNNNLSTASTEQASNSNTELSISIKSDPDGADIMVDGKFVGNTPSIVKLKTGDHTISIKKKGFTLWERIISLSGGSEISINADLEKMP